MTTSVVITDAGNVYGSTVDFGNNTLGPVFEFGGAKIGYNYPQDRFMMQMNDNLFVTNNGNVCGAGINLAGQAINQVSPLPGARIGYNPQDRFMVATENTLYVITNTGDVYWAAVQGPGLGPVSHLGGSKIGYNPQDKWMVAIGSMLAVIASAGDVYGAYIEFGPGFAPGPVSLGPVIQFSGAKIGYNPQDRFMTISDLGNNTLFVITNTGDVYGSVVDTTAKNIGPVTHFTGARIGYNPQDKWMVAVDPFPVTQAPVRELESKAV